MITEKECLAKEPNLRELSDEAIKFAMDNHYCIKIRYNDGTKDAAKGGRIMGIYAWGRTLANNEAIRCYQYNGATKSFSPDWKMIRLDRITSFRIIKDIKFDSAPAGFNYSNDLGMIVVKRITKFKK